MALIAIFSGEITEDNWAAVYLRDAAGTANIIRSEFSIASLGDEVIMIVSGKGTPGTNLWFSFSVCSSWASPEVLASSITSLFSRALIMPRVVPQVVVPIIAILAILLSTKSFSSINR